MAEERKWVLVTGASGYIGTRLVGALHQAGYSVTALVRRRDRISIESVTSMGKSLEVVEADFSQPINVKLNHSYAAAFYLLHSMATHREYFNAETTCARHFTDWADQLTVAKVVYLGAMIPKDSDLSDHLQSREQVRAELIKGKAAVTTLRASIIVGAGSASFEMIRDLTEKLPVMITPKWVTTQCQPIAVRNVIRYLVGTVECETVNGGDYDIGGPDILTYGDLLRGYAKARGLHRLMLPIPFFSARLSSHWLHLITSTNFQLAQSLVGSLRMRTVSENETIRELIPQPLYSYQEALERAFTKIAQNKVPSTWFDSLVSGTLNHQQLINVQVPEHGVLEDRRISQVDDPEACLDRIWALGGNNGWPSMNWAWRIRGKIDKLVGGIGLRRGRRHPSELRNGDALDFWRVLLADRENQRLILYAEMKLPGEAWLEFKLENGMLQQRAVYRPKGVLGRLYWWMMVPAHALLFPRMAKKLARGY